MKTFLTFVKGLTVICIGIGLLCSESFSMGFDRDVHGRVTDAHSGEPLPGVNVVIKGATAGTTTDQNGAYRVRVSDGAVLIFSFVGYQSREIEIGTHSELNVTLQVDPKSLEEIVIVGYGTQKKSDLTGAVHVVTSKDITQLPVDRVEQGLQGKVPGLQVVQNSGAPASSLRVRIRGSNSIQYGNDPLYVIDGFPIEGSSAFINPNDVESVTVLKDASATAIYGSRGANGVIIITTKKGLSGKTQIDYDFYLGFQSVTKKLDLLNAKEWATLDREFWRVFRNGSLLSRAYPEDEIAQMGEGTDWQDAIIRTAPMQSHNISIRGGSDKTRFALSGNFFNQDGIVVYSNFKKGNVGLNLDHEVSKRFNLGVNLSANFNVDNPIMHSTTGHDNSGVIYAALHSVPTLPVKNPDGTYSSQDKLWNVQGLYANPFIQNPVEMAERADLKNTSSRFLGNAFLQYRITDELTARISAGGFVTNSKSRSFLPSDFVLSRTTGGSASISESQTINWVNENTLTYAKTFGNNRLEVLGGFTLQRQTAESLGATTWGFFTNTTGYNNLGLGETPQYPSSNVSQWSLVSYLGRVNFDIQNKYLFTASARYDGSSRFADKNKYGFFPSAAFAWRVLNENFLADAHWVSDLKLRTSFGVTGNQAIPLYQNVPTYGLGSPYVIGNNFVTTIVPTALVNENMKWESTHQFDVGLDFGILSNRLTLVADFYNKVTKDLLFNVSIPRQSGFSSSLMNVGSVRNRGVELGLNAVVVDRVLRWSLMGTLSINRNKVLKLADADRFFGSTVSSYLIQRNGGSASVVMVGQPIGVFWGNIHDGLWQTEEDFKAGHMKNNANTGPGFENYRDIDGNGVFEEGIDETVIGNPHPKYEFGLNNTLTYKGFDLSIFVNGTQGNDILNLNLIDLTTQVNGMNGLAIYKEAWTGPGTSNRIAKIDRPDGRQGTFPNRVATNYIEDGSFVRIRNITLGYTLPLASNSKIARARIYVAGENLITFTKYSGYNPEVNSMGNNNTVLGVDMNAYPLSKNVRIGVQVGF